MKFATLIISIACLIAGTAQASTVGFTTLSVPDGDDAAVEVVVWYPSDAAPEPTVVGHFTQDVAPDGRVFGAALPLIVLSHGTGSDPTRHGDTAHALAEAGFVVAAPVHPGDNALDQSRAVDVGSRTRHLVRVVEHMATEWGPGTIDAGRIGAFGFSAGAFTVLVTAGGEPDAGRVRSHCEANPGFFDCRLLAAQASEANLAEVLEPSFVRDTRIRAVAVAAPALGYTFDRDALRGVDLPVQLWRAGDDVILPHPHYAEPVRGALPRAPEFHVVEGAGHFDFLAACSQALAEAAPQICASKPGFDRADFKRHFNAEVVRFFTESLRAD
jgi:predicted dienelactone hydrolase